MMDRGANIRVPFAFVLAAAMAASSVARADELESPYGLSYTAADDSVVVAWYYPGVNRTTIGDRAESPVSYLIYSTQYVGGQVARELSLTSSEIAVEAIEIRLWPGDAHPDQPGSADSPFRLALYSGLPANLSTTPLWQDTVAGSTATDADTWCYFPVRSRFQSDDAIWAVVEWLESTPAAPALAVSYTICATDQWTGEMVGGSLQWSRLADMNVHMRLIGNVCDTMIERGDSEDPPDSFSIFTLTADGSAEFGEWSCAPGTMGLHYVFERAEVEGEYLAVAAWKDEILGPKSSAVLIDIATDIGSDVEAVTEPATLFQNYPNPFNRETQIIAVRATEIAIIDMLGRTVRHLQPIAGANGGFTSTWDGRDDTGKEVPSGVYFYRQRGESGARKMILLK